MQLTSWQLPASLLRGQGYDGAGAMSGHTKGAAARINAKYPKHCIHIVQLIDSIYV